MPHTHFGPSYQQCLFHYLLQVLTAHSWGWCHASQTLYSDCHYFKQAFILLGGIFALCVWTVKLWVNHWADSCWELKLLMVLYLKSSIFLGYFKESLAGGLEIELMKDSRLWQAVNRKRVLKEKQRLWRWEPLCFSYMVLAFTCLLQRKDWKSKPPNDRRDININWVTNYQLLE